MNFHHIISKTTAIVYFCAGKPIGRILELKYSNGFTAYQYFKRGARSGGEPFDTIELCKASLVD